MSGLRTMLAKELAETVHTWRIWVLPGFLLFSGVSAALVTYFMPALLESLGGETAGIAIALPDPTAAMAYTEYLGNLSELVILALVIAYGGIVSSELRSGTGALTLAKPLSRTAFVTAKWLSQLCVIVLATALATAVCVGVTAALLSTGPLAALAAATGLWLAFATLLLSLMVLLSVLLPAPAAASGAGIGIYIALIVIGQFGRLADWSPSGLPSAGIALLQGLPAVWVAPLITSLAASAVLMLAALWFFARREI